LLITSLIVHDLFVFPGLPANIVELPNLEILNLFNNNIEVGKFQKMLGDLYEGLT